MPATTLTGWLVVDWMTGSHRTPTSKPGATVLGKNELLATITIDIHVLEVDIPEPSMEIDGHEPQVQARIRESLDEDELPDGADRAAEVVADPSPAPT